MSRTPTRRFIRMLAACAATAVVAGAAGTGTALGTTATWSQMGLGVSAPALTVMQDGTGGAFVGGQFGYANESTLNPLSPGTGAVLVSDIARWSNDTWSEAAPGGTDDAVTSFAHGSNGTVYAAGYFTSIGGVSHGGTSSAPTGLVAQWDGSTWSWLGGGITATGGKHVDALAVDSRGNVYAGGEFIKAGATTVANVAKWSSSGWSAMGQGLNGRVRALAVDEDGVVYAGGDFTQSGDGTVNLSHVAKWNGSSWARLDNGIAPDGTTGSVKALAVDGHGSVYAAGDFTGAGGLAAGRIAKWNTATGDWTGLGTGTDGTVKALAFDGQCNLYVGGAFSEAGQKPIANVAVWNSTGWSALGAGTSGQYPEVLSLSAHGTTGLYAAGTFTSPGARVAHATVFNPPCAPTGPTATAGDGQATVRWSAPDSDGGSNILAYTVTSSPDARTCETSGTSCTVTGLANGTPYVFTITARNTEGISYPSDLTAAVTPTGLEPGSAPSTAPSAQPSASAAGTPPKPQRLTGTVRVRRGVVTTTGPLPEGATRVSQDARAGGRGATSTFFEMARAKTSKGTCRTAKRTYTCTVRLPKGTWTLVTTARGTTGIVASSTRRVRAR